MKILDFNSHAHVERDACEKTGKLSDFNFNSHAHVERDYEFSKDSGRLNISTHTLTWSVTKNEYYSLKKINISTHTLTWSVTNCNTSFNLFNVISTHTLTWSVTL